jgi:hypothetical protein
MTDRQPELQISTGFRDFNAQNAPKVAIVSETFQ